MEYSQIPQWIVASTISAYWTCVLVMSIRSRIKFRVPSGSVPKTALEKLMWLIWVPTIVAWIFLSWNSANQLSQSLTSGITAIFSQAIIWVAAFTAVTAFLLTTRCWMRMGKNWSMAVRPDKQTELITDGAFSSVRHPIYALSLLLMISTLIVLTNWGMALVATAHCSLLILKAFNEERYLTETHGQQYRDYLQHTNRFVPVRAVFNR